MPNDLRSRAAGRDVATRDDADTKKKLIQNVQRMEEQFALAMPRGAEAAQLVRDVITAINSNPKLAQCEPATVFGGAMTMAQLGLRPGVLGHGWLLPFWDSKSRGFKAQLVIGYQGLIELAHRSGKVKSLIARTVYKNDHFDIQYGLEDNLVHRPAHGERGEAIGYYSIVKLTTGGHAFIYMTQTEMETYRDRYAMAKTKEGKVVGPWRDQFEGMAHKTVVRQLAKWMPKGTDIATALEVDGTVRLDTAPQLSTNAPTISHPVPDDDIVDGEAVDEPPAGVNTNTSEVQDEPPVEDPPPADWPSPATPGAQA